MNPDSTSYQLFDLRKNILIFLNVYFFFTFKSLHLAGHFFIQQIIFKFLLHARNDGRQWGYKKERKMAPAFIVNEDAHIYG